MIVTRAAEFFTAIPHGKSRIMGLDLGLRKIGVAILHLGTGVTSPVGVIQRHGAIRLDIEAINKIIKEWDAGGIVVGIPLGMDGSEGEAAAAASKFIAELAHLQLPVIGHDERLSTKAAHSLMKSLTVERKARHQADDMISASLILEHFYASHKNGVSA